MRALSLFSGCLGLDLGLEDAGFEFVAYCERNRACQRVIAARRPDVPLYRDVRTVGDGVGPVDLVVGGFPCTDVSQAGSRRGLGGRESRLWGEMARAIRLLRPRYVVVENVSGLQVRGLEDVIGDLAQARYVGRWLRVRSSDLGAPHRRERILILATDADVVARAPSGERDGRSGASGVEAAHGRETGRPLTRATGGVGAPPDADQRRRQVVGLAQPAGLESASGREPLGRLPDGRQYDAATCEWGRYEPAIRRWERILGRPAPEPTDDRGRLMPTFVEWMLGFPHDWTRGDTRSSRLRMLGNSVQVQVGALAGRLLVEER